MAIENATVVARLPGRAQYLAVRHVPAGDRAVQHAGVRRGRAGGGAAQSVRPSIVLVAVALAAAAFGVVLHNADLSALAAALLILSLARPAPAPE